jgi:hypothetical protein
MKNELQMVVCGGHCERLLDRDCLDLKLVHPHPTHHETGHHIARKESSFMQSAFVLYHRWDHRCGVRALPDLSSEVHGQ